MTAAAKVALIAVTRHGCDQARLLRARLRHGDVYRSSRHGDPEHRWEKTFAGPLSDVVPALFRDYEQLVFFLAAGAVVRLVAPCLADKTTDPGVLSIDEAGCFVIALLSGHKGGANSFARTVAGCLGAIPVVTTASDVVGGLSLDLLEEEFGWKPQRAELLKETAAALVNGEPISIIQEIGTKGCWLDELGLPENATFATQPGGGLEPRVWITDRRILPSPALRGRGEDVLWFRPASLVLGVGCERGISQEALEDGLHTFLIEHEYAEASIAKVASVNVKADEEGLILLAKRRGWELVFYSPEELANVDGIPNPSAIVEKCVGTRGVAEPAALLAAGVDELLVPKHIVTSARAPQRMTFALARDARYQQRRQRGRVIFVGAGPGDPELLTIKARRLLQKCDVLVYAGSLIPEQVLREAAPTAERHNSAHLTLEQVMAIMLPAARAGKQVVRLQSGDTSIYSAIQEQMQVLDEEGIDYDVVPGISSFQAAAAALCSELTIPEMVQTVILTRGAGTTSMPETESLQALAQHGSTLCIFLSARLGDDVQRQLLTAYAADTPVALAYRVSWPDEHIVVTQLDQLADQLRSHAFDRTTLILVGPALAGRQNRSRLYDRSHGHIFRKRSREEDCPSA